MLLRVGAVAWFRWSLLGFALLLPLALGLILPEQAARNASEWVKYTHQFVQVHLRQPVQTGGAGILAAWGIYWALTAWSLRRRPERAVLDAHGLCFAFPFLAAVTTALWYGVRHLLSPRPSDGGAAFWVLMEGVFLLGLGASGVALMGFWTMRLVVARRGASRISS